MSWPVSSFLTVGGRPVDLFNVEASDIEPHEMAHALSLICRYAGHVRHFYSVAQHAVLVADYVANYWQGEKELELAALVHDCSEGLGLGDLISPAKRALRADSIFGSAFDRLESKAEIAVGVFFGVCDKIRDPRIKRADRVVMWAEMRDLRGRSEDGGFSVDFHRALGFDLPDELSPLPVDRIVALSPDLARVRWLRRLAALRPDLNINPTWEPPE